MQYCFPWAFICQQEGQLTENASSLYSWELDSMVSISIWDVHSNIYLQGIICLLISEAIKIIFSLAVVVHA